MENEERILNAVNALEAIPYGSLWFVEDTLWEEAIPNFNRKRKAHPGLVFRKKRYVSLDNTVPMMIGTSKNSFPRKGLRIANVTEPDSKKQKRYTYFSVVRPVNTGITVRDFVEPKSRVTRNTHKPNVDVNEFFALKKYTKHEV